MHTLSTTLCLFCSGNTRSLPSNAMGLHGLCSGQATTILLPSCRQQPPQPLQLCLYRLQPLLAPLQHHCQHAPLWVCCWVWLYCRHCLLPSSELRLPVRQALQLLLHFLGLPCCRGKQHPAPQGQIVG